MQLQRRSAFFFGLQQLISVALEHKNLIFQHLLKKIEYTFKIIAISRTYILSVSSSSAKTWPRLARRMSLSWLDASLSGEEESGHDSLPCWLPAPAFGLDWK